MGQSNKNTITVLDIGSAKVAALICETTETGLRYRGHGITESRGSRKGVITELDKAVQSIQKAVEEAEKVAECSVGNALIAVGGAHIKGVTSRGGVQLGSRAREVTRDDIRDAVEKARSVHLPADREVLHLLPQEFILDDQSGVRDPAGMMGARLEVNLHIITGSASATQNVVTAANRAGIHVDNVVYEGMMSADSTLRSDEKEIGVCLADIGAGSTNLIVYNEGMVAHSGAELTHVEGLFAEQSGYATPKVDVRGAVFRDDGSLLMVREATDGRWSLPGGWADVNQSPREAILREVLEESGFEVGIQKLAAVFDRSRHPHFPPRPFHVYKLFFVCTILGGAPRTSLETTEIGFFTEENLPADISIGRVVPYQIGRMFEHYRAPELPTEFD